VSVHRIALTGGLSTGKSYVRHRFGSAGIPTIDADQLAREAVAPGSAGLAAVTARFGPGILDGDALNRKALGAIVFADARAREDLEAIVHPIVREALDRWFTGLDASVHPFAVAEIPLLYETGRERQFDAVVVAACARDRQVDRAMARDGASRDEVERRLAAQRPIEEKVARADYVVSTDGTPDATDAQVTRVIEALDRRFPSPARSAGDHTLR
jgi:dephospho-CoA kinase